MRPFEVLSPCPRCRVEGALVELLDPPTVILASCRLCSYAVDAGEVVRLGDPYVEPVEVIDALGRWAEREGEGDAARFVATNFCGRSLDEVVARILAGEPVETSFDVIARLFPGMGGGRVAERGHASESRVVTHEVPAPPPEAPPRAPDPRDVSRALASMMLADGRVRPAERAAFERLRARLGAPAIPDAELRVWRPLELGVVPDPAALLDAMRQVALADREVDSSEVRLLREYARAWSLPAPRLPRPGPMAAIGRSVAALVGL